MSRIAATLIVLGLYALHQDTWFWNDATPLVFGVLPIGLFYHVAYTVGIAVVMAVLVKTCWPSHLERPGGFAPAAPPTRSLAGAPTPRSRLRQGSGEARRSAFGAKAAVRAGSLTLAQDRESSRKTTTE
jgi:hypothetical protein